MSDLSPTSCWQTRLTKGSWVLCYSVQHSSKNTTVLGPERLSGLHWFHPWTFILTFKRWNECGVLQLCIKSILLSSTLSEPWNVFLPSVTWLIPSVNLSLGFIDDTEQWTAVEGCLFILHNTGTVSTPMNQNKSPILYKHTHTQGGSNRAALRFWNRRVELQHHMDLNLLTRVYLEMEFFFFSLMSSLNLSIITTGSNISDYITQPWDCLLSILSIHQTVTPTLCSKVLTHKNKYAELVFPEKVTLI